MRVVAPAFAAKVSPVIAAARAAAEEGVDVGLREALATDGFSRTSFEEDVVGKDNGGVAVLKRVQGEGYVLTCSADTII